MRNAQWQALGLAEADCEKPKIAVVNSSSELASCCSHLDEVAKVVKAAIRAAGGLPFEIRTAAPSDFITGAGARGAYMLAARDLVTNDIEVAVEGAQLDGMACLTSCDKTVPGQLMAAARLNIPTLVVPCGYQASGMHRGQHCDIEDVFVGAMHVVTGAMDVETLVGMSRQAIRLPGVCSGMGTASSMHIVCEALGDTITIDLDARRCDLEISAEEMDRRRAAWVAPAPLFDRGWLQIYRANVGPLPQGAVLTRNNT